MCGVEEYMAKMIKSMKEFNVRMLSIVCKYIICNLQTLAFFFLKIILLVAELRELQ